ncbi:hypothetical protein EZJ49_10520 [Bdellovibrio bacteriovorus]|uniref:hypothetical protein n=1 Tax=Bdellovibrio bacteriovorus TaxID=959 RepID=UPI0021D2F150|nr:hypothetical protein [Bdellovibrio bacteriovorus]UXR63508.1 hypothetical protein EZJ49_10520 [Bdellovibrio bacteriovorus]
MREFLKLIVISLGFILMLQGCSAKNGLPGVTLPSVGDDEDGGPDDGGDGPDEEETEPESPIWQVSDFKTTSSDAWVSTCAEMNGSWVRYIFVVDTRLKIWGINYASEAACLSHTNGDILEEGDFALPYVVPVEVGSDPNTQFNTSSTGTFMGMETDNASIIDFIFWGKASAGRDRVVIAYGSGYMDGAGGVSYSTLNGSPAKNIDFENVTATDFTKMIFLMDRVSDFNLNDYVVEE